MARGYRAEYRQPWRDRLKVISKGHNSLTIVMGLCSSRAAAWTISTIAIQRRACGPELLRTSADNRQAVLEFLRHDQLLTMEQKGENLILRQRAAERRE